MMIRTVVRGAPCRRSILEPRKKRDGQSDKSLAVQMETDLRTDFHRNWLSIFCGWLKSPLAHGSDRLLLQTGSQRARHYDVLGVSIDINDERQQNCSLQIRFSRLFGILRINHFDCLRSGDCATNFSDNGASVSAIGSGAAFSGGGSTVRKVAKWIEVSQRNIPSM